MEVDAVTNTTDETLTECNAISERIMLAAGPELKEEIITRALGNYLQKYMMINSVFCSFYTYYLYNSINSVNSKFGIPF